MGTLDESVMEYPTKGGAAIVLRHYTTGDYNNKDNPIKQVHHVLDAAAFLEKITQGGSATEKGPVVCSGTTCIVPTGSRDDDGLLVPRFGRRLYWSVNNYYF
jgi:hypothetical protein